MLPVGQIICGSALEVLRTFPADSVNCCVSSPPFWALRDYGIEGQLGLEPTFEEYIEKLCTVYDEVKRVLCKDGTCWVNLGDTYGGGCGGGDTQSAKQLSNDGSLVKRNSLGYDKCLMLIPQRFAIEMVNRGWILRNVIIWHKPNPMPSSAKDRFTVDFEYVFFFVKSKRYWFEPQYEEYVLPMNRWGGIYTDGNVPGSKYLKEDIDPAQLTQRPRSMRPNPLGRNKRCVWTIPTQPCPEAHFATFPDKLVEPMILAGCPEFVCKRCGKARVKIYESIGGTIGKSWHSHKSDSDIGMSQYNPEHHKGGLGKEAAKRGNPYTVTFKGYTDCGCGEGWRPGVMCDPFVVRARPVRSLPN